MEQVKQIISQVQTFLEQYFGMFRDNLAKWLDGSLANYYGLIAAGLAVLVILMIIGLVSMMRNHPKLLVFLIIIAALFGAACLFIPTIG